VTFELRPTAPIAADALLPGDPGRALALAQELLEHPRMCNHHRGLWGYSGRTAAGHELTIQATGIGGPSAAIVLFELSRHGVRRAIRLGTCVAPEGGVPPGTLLLAEAALAGEGTTRALGADGAVHPDPQLHARLLDVAGATVRAGIVASVDVLLPTSMPAHKGDRGEGAALAIEMGTATLFALAARLGVGIASGLVVARRGAAGQALDDEALERASLELGALAAQTLGG
jgi:uridine phosphorylase